MGWEDRVREAAYTSPSGTRLVFDYEDVSVSITKKTTGFTFPDADGTLVQDQGVAGRKYPLRVFFWGDDYDEEAKAFDAALTERGAGRLEHPIYGVVDVVPFGVITRRDDLKTKANQAVIDVTFWSTIGVVYPTSQSDPASDVLASVEEYNAAAAEEFEEVTDLTSAVNAATFKNTYQAVLDSVSSGLEAVAATQEDVQAQFNAVVDSINNGIDTLVFEPLALAFQTIIAVQSPARALTSVSARLNAYRELSLLLITGDKAISEPSIDPSSSNAFHTKDLYSMTYVTGQVLSVVNNQFETKTDALDAAEEILDLFSEVVAWRDSNYRSLSEIDTGTSYQQLQEAVAVTAGFLVEISFTLKQERKIILDRDRTFIDLVAELYQDTDPEYDFFISSNDLTGSEILELPRGREIVYYI